MVDHTNSEFHCQNGDSRTQVRSQTEQTLLALNFGFATASVLEAALELRVFDRFENKARTPESIALDSGWSVEATRRWFRALAHLGLLDPAPDAAYTVPADVSALLGSHSHTNMSSHLQAAYAMRATWDTLAESVRTGTRSTRLSTLESRSKNVHFFARGGPQLGEDARAVGELCATNSPATAVVLYASGPNWASALAQVNEHLTVIAMDTPEFLAGCSDPIGSPPLDPHRVHYLCALPGVQMHPIDAEFVVVPPLIRFLDDDDALAVLAGAVSSVAPAGRLLLVDVSSFDDSGQNAPPPMLDLSLWLHTTGGRIRDVEWYTKSLRSIDAQVVEVNTLGLLMVIQAERM